VTSQTDILAILRRLRDVEYSEVYIGDSNLSVTLRKTNARLTGDAMHREDVAQSESATTDQVAGADTHTIDAPMTGIFYCAPRPGEKPFVEIGDQISADTIVCIIEVMKLMNSIQAHITGVVEEVLVRDGQMVDQATPLFRIGVE
jgi:acetyl-CoA carboxylase biotin carboxyl carrier protein